MKPKFPFLRQDSIAAQAKKLRDDAYREIQFPLDLEHLVFEYLYDRDGLRFSEDEILGESDGSRILGYMEPKARKVKVCASLKNENTGRYRFTVAHEIGHWVLHRDLFLTGQTELFSFDPMITLERNLESPDKTLGEEWQANAFASWFLIGGAKLKAVLEARYTNLPIETSGNLSEKAWAIAIDKHHGPPLWQIFGVSPTAMKWALIKRNLVASPLPLFS